jgi:thiamine biosynthesis lipoprotein ApbE
MKTQKAVPVTDPEEIRRITNGHVNIHRKPTGWSGAVSVDETKNRTAELVLYCTKCSVNTSGIYFRPEKSSDQLSRKFERA